MTIKDHIKELSSQIKGDLTPGLASDLLIQFSNLLGNIYEDLLDKQMEYNRMLASQMEGNNGVVAKARIVADTTQEFHDYQEAKSNQEYVQELIRSLKTNIKVQLEEMRNAKY